MARYRRVGSLILLALLGSACDPGAGVSQHRRPIYYGTPDTGPEHQAVVALVEDWGGVLEADCTGTLITPDVVLTAAHCLDDVAMADIQIYFGDDVPAGGELIAIADWVQHPGWEPGNPDSADDIAMVLMADSAPTGVEPILPLPASLGLTAADEGTELDFSGFGETEDITYDVKLHIMVPIGRVCDGPDECSDGGNWIVPRAFGYSQTDGGPCIGDSGGPAFIVRNGVEYVAGITAYGDDCLGYGVSTSVDPYQAWVYDWAGITAPEACTNGIDDDGDELIDCDDPDCAEHGCCVDPGSCEPKGSDGGCRQAAGAPPFPAGSLLLLLLLLVRRRRR